MARRKSRYGRGRRFSNISPKPESLRLEPLEDRRMLTDPHLVWMAGANPNPISYDSGYPSWGSYFEWNQEIYEGSTGSVTFTRNWADTTATVDFILEGDAERGFDYLLVGADYRRFDGNSITFPVNVWDVELLIYAYPDSEREGQERVWVSPQAQGGGDFQIGLPTLSEPPDDGYRREDTQDTFFIVDAVRGADDEEVPSDNPPECTCGSSSEQVSPSAGLSSFAGAVLPAIASKHSPASDGVGLSISNLSGGLTIEQEVVDGFQLVYRSDTVSAPVINETFTLPNLASSPQQAPPYVKAQLTWQRTSNSSTIVQSPVIFSTSGIDPTQTFDISVPGDSTVASQASGEFEVTMELTYLNSSQQPISLGDLAPVTRTTIRTVQLVNRSSSEYGAGWGIKGVGQQEWIRNSTIDSGTLFRYVQGDGDVLYIDRMSGVAELGDTTNSTFLGSQTHVIVNKLGERREFGGPNPLVRKLATFTSREGLTTQYQYDSSNRLEYVTNALGQITATLEYYQSPDSRAGLLKKVSRFDGQVASFDYDANGRMVSLTKGEPSVSNTEIVRFEYDGQTDFINNVTRSDVGGSLSETTRLAYSSDVPGHVSAATAADGRVTTYKAKQLESVPRSSGSIVKPATPLVATLTTAEGEASFKLDRYGYSLSAADVNGSGYKVGRNLHGQVLIDAESAHIAPSVTEELNFLYPVTAWKYDSNGDYMSHNNLKERTLPDGRKQTWEYQEISIGGGTRRFDALTSFTDEFGETHTFTYDSDGNLETDTHDDQEIANDPETVTTFYPSTTYGISGLLATETTPDGVVTTYDYYSTSAPSISRGRVKQITIGSGSLERWTKYAYDFIDVNNKGLGWTETVTELIDRVGSTDITRSTKYTYDVHGNLVAEQEPDPTTGAATGPITNHEYDAFDRLVRTTSADPDGTTGPLPSIETAYQYDVRGNLVGEYQTSNAFNTAPVKYSSASTTYTATDADAKTEVDLFVLFTDVEDADSALVYTIVENNKPTLFDAIYISNDYPKKLILDYAGTTTTTALAAC